MSQAASWGVSEAGPQTPGAHAVENNDSLDAILSQHLGASRPPYAVQSTIWNKDLTASSPPLIETYLFDGTDDILVSTFNIAANTIEFSGLIIGANVQAFNAGISSVPFIQGVHSSWMPASNMTIPPTSGAEAGLIETTINAVPLNTLNFDPTVDEYGTFAIKMPKSWNGGTITADFIWSHAATTVNFDVAWGLQAVSIANDETADSAYGTAVVVSDTGGTTDKVYISSETGAITIAGAAAEEWVSFRVLRDVSADAMAIDARLHGVNLNFNFNSGNDA